MEEPVKNATAQVATVDPLANQTDLTPEQRDLLRSLHKSFQQAARGETRPFRDFLREWRLEREAEEYLPNADA